MKISVLIAFYLNRQVCKIQRKCIDKLMIFLSDIDECVDEGICGNGTCYNTDGSYSCLCDGGSFKYDKSLKACVGEYRHLKGSLS